MKWGEIEQCCCTRVAEDQHAGETSDQSANDLLAFILRRFADRNIKVLLKLGRDRRFTC